MKYVVRHRQSVVIKSRVFESGEEVKPSDLEVAGKVNAEQAKKHHAILVKKGALIDPSKLDKAKMADTPDPLKQLAPPEPK